MKEYEIFSDDSRWEKFVAQTGCADWKFKALNEERAIELFREKIINHIETEKNLSKGCDYDLLVKALATLEPNLEASVVTK